MSEENGFVQNEEGLLIFLPVRDWLAANEFGTGICLRLDVLPHPSAVSMAQTGVFQVGLTAPMALDLGARLVAMAEQELHRPPARSN